MLKRIYTTTLEKEQAIAEIELELATLRAGLTPEQQLVLAHLPGSKSYTAAVRASGIATGAAVTARANALSSSPVMRTALQLESELHYLRNCTFTTQQKEAWLVETVERCLQAKEVRDAKGNVVPGQYCFDARGTVHAIQELNKMSGDYAAQKKTIDHTNSDGTLSVAQQTDQASADLSRLSPAERQAFKALLLKAAHQGELIEQGSGA